jgi:multiple sugar transport system permease protein
MVAPVMLPGKPPDAVDNADPIVGRHDVSRHRLAQLGWRFSTPALLVVAAVTLFPIVYSIIMSLRNVSETGSGIQSTGFGFFNYRTIFDAPEWRYALYFTVVYTVITVLVEVVLGTMVALVLERMVRGRGMMMAILLIPWSIITVISAQLWKYMYAPTFGVITHILSSLGLGSVNSIQILGAGSVPTIAALMIADIWKTTPFVAIIVLAGLVMLSDDVYEAAEVDGASGWTTFWKITLPLLRPTVALAILFRVLQAFGLFDLPYVLTGGDGGHTGYATTSLAVLSYQVLTQGKLGVAAAISTSTALLVVIGCFCFIKVFKNQASEGN